MFEKFTEKAVDAVKISQITAIELNHEKIYPEHLLIGLAKQRSGMVTKMFSISKLKIDELKDLVKEKLSSKTTEKPIEFVVFSDSVKQIFNKSLNIAKKLGNSYIQPEHIFLALVDDKNSKTNQILSELDFDISKTKNVLLKVMDKKKKTKDLHPEGTAKKLSEDKYGYILSILKESSTSEIFERAVAKLSTSNYEIMGTEQIIQSILEDENTDLANILSSLGINADSFAQKLADISSRQAEFEDKQVIFTPNALKTILLAIETAKELGSASIQPEHVILGLLKSKSGIAYNIFKEFNVDDELLEDKIIKPIEKQMNETLLILRLSKQEARRIGKNIVGSELILLGMLLEGTGPGAMVLKELGITVKDARQEVEKLIGVSEDYSEKEFLFSERAKLILEEAWNIAKEENKTKIGSRHLLLAICKHPKSLAMKALTHLGVDVVEIKQGLQNKNLL